MFLQQLLRQGIFTIHKIPTRVNPADLNTKRLSVERRKLLSNLCGLYPICAQSDRDEEVLMTRRIQRNMAHKLVQALQIVSMSLLQGCSHNLSGKELHGQQGLRGEVRPGSGPVQALCSTMSSWWTTSWTSTTWWTLSSTRMLVADMAMGAMVVLAILVSMVPRRGRGGRQQRGRGGQHEGEGYPDRRGRVPAGEDQTENRPTGSRDQLHGAEGEHGTSRRSRTTSRERSESRAEVIAALHRKVALMFATVVEGNYVPRQPVTPDGVRTTLRHLLAASRALDSGSYVSLREAFNCLDGPHERRARRLLNDMLYAWERRHGRLPDVPGDVSLQLLERYVWELRRCCYPVLRLEEMVYGSEAEPSEDTHRGDEASESHYSSYTIEGPFNSNASRSRDSEQCEGEGRDSERFEVEGEEDRLVRYRMSSMGSVRDPELWREINHVGSDDGERSRDTGHGDDRNNGGEEPDGEPGFGDDGEGPDFEPGLFTAMVQRLSREAGCVGVPRPGGQRDPVTYPPIQQDEMQGAYPGAGVDLTPYSTYEKVTRMIECYHARLVECEYTNEPERYEEILREIRRLEGLQALADDVRPSEMANLPLGV